VTDHRIVVFGASGRTGRLVVTQALRRGHEVVAAVRDASKQWFPDSVTVHQGDPHDPKAVEAVLTGADVTISALGPIAGEASTEISDATRTIAEVMQRTGPHRLVIAANDTVLSEDEVAGEFANVTAEHRRDLAILRGCALAWTVVAAPLLIDEPRSGSYDALVEGSAPGGSITRSDYAAALLDALEHDEWIGHVVGVANLPSERSV
jgi:putative NADH-flavin reductase